MADSALFTVVILNVVICSTYFSAFGYSKQDLDELLVSREALESRIENSTSEWPVCIFYKNPGMSSQLEKGFVNFLRGLPIGNFVSNWTVVAFNVDRGLLHWNGNPGMVPLLQCHTWTSDSPLTFMFSKPPLSSQSFYNWFKHVGRVFAKRLQIVTSDNLPGVISGHGGHTLLGLPGHLFYQGLEKTLKQVAKRWKAKIKVLIAIPLTAEEKHMMHEFNVSQLPAVIIFSSQESGWLEERKPISLLQGVEEVTERGIEILLVTLHSQAVHLTQDNFFEEVMETSHPHPPVAVCFYSPRSPHTLNYLDAFHRSLETFTKMELLLRFKLLNIITHPQVIPRYVNATEVYSVPFTVVFWQETITGTQRFEIKQRVFDKDIPTPLLFFEFLQSLSMKLQFIAEDNGELFNPWKPSDDSKNVCGLERWKSMCSLDDNSTSEHKTDVEHKQVMYGPQLSHPSWTVTVQHQTNKQMYQIPYVNDKIWASLIEQSWAPTKSYDLLPVQQQQQQPSLFSVNVVVFITHGCGYCVKVMPSIEKISKAVTYVGASLYVHNCTSDPHTCQRYSITGYPTVTAFRSLSWFTVERCSRSRTSSLRLDYHGPVVPKLVLEWVSNISQPAVNRRFLFDSPPDMDMDVRLIGTIYTRSLARRFLPTSLANTWYPFRCFQLICELLFGRVPCYMIYTRDVSDDGSKRRAKDQDLFLSKLELQRRDGVRAKVFQLGQNVETTINNQRDSRLHMFHKTHRYNLPKHFRCEHDHSLCTDVAVRFVLDHRRLPVVHMTSEAFHIKLGSEEEASYEPFGHNLPILIALVHRENVSSGSSFYKELTEAAYALYRDMVTVTVDVDEFAYWTSNFVPNGYHFKHGLGRRSEEVPSLYHYPRLCIIQHDDHRHAAFYPPVEELQALGTSIQARLDLINGQQIIKFAWDYLKDPEGSLVKTEEF